MKYWTCPDGATGTASIGIGANEVPTCTAGQGQWVQEPMPWWAYEIPPGQVTGLFTAMILFAAVCWVGNKIGESIEKH